MESSQETNGNEYENILNELKAQLVEANKILEILNPLIKNGKAYKDLFESIRHDIEKSHIEVKNSKSTNTKYLNDLIKSKGKLEAYTKEVKEKKIVLQDLIKSISKLQKNAQLKLTSIDKLKIDSESNKKTIAEAKNTAENLIKKITSIKDESDSKIKEFREDKKESEGIRKKLRTLQDDAEKFYNEILEKHDDLFSKQVHNKKSLIDELEENIEKAENFKVKLDQIIEPSLKEKQKNIDNITVEIKEKNKQIDSLLFNATAGALDEGYLESMHEYSFGKIIKYKKGWSFSNIFHNLNALLNNSVFRFTKNLFNYIVFIGPLVIIITLFLNTGLSVNLEKVLSLASTKPTFRDLILFKVIIAFPLLWISRFGQKNISQRKRLFEEYNHKSRVVRMYLMFTSNQGKNYKLTNLEKLETILIDAIANNPAKHLGRSETIIDKIIEKFHFEGFYKKLKEEVLNDIKETEKDENSKQNLGKPRL